MNQPVDRNSPEFKLFCKLSRIIYSNDPMGIGYEEDEYDPEARTILPRLKDCQSLDDCERVIKEEFVTWFTEDSVKDIDFRPISIQIWEAWINYQKENTAF